MARVADRGLLFSGPDWSFDTLRRTTDAIEAIARTDLGLDCYPNQIEIISTEQMLDAYSSTGMPLMYKHWSFGKAFIHHERLYRKGARGLAYEIVINSNPCISYCLEENTMPMQALVIAHAAFGHNHFFKNNHLFRQWTDPDGILDYLEYARGFLKDCEDRHGARAVERTLDAAHSLMSASVFRHRRPPQPSLREERLREERRLREEEAAQHYLWSRIEPARAPGLPETDAAERRRALGLPEENILYFLERHSPSLAPWQRQALRIVRNISQYFYPQRQTQVMNEGCACFTHFHILNRLHAEGRIEDGAMLEILHSHTSVLTQPDFDSPFYGGINPYTLGFAMMQDIRRICEQPTAEDRDWFPAFAGSGDWRALLGEAWANFRDESFIQQFLSPKVMRDLRLFAVTDTEGEDVVRVSAIHDEGGYHAVRDALARSYDLSTRSPDIEVIDADLAGDRLLRLRHRMRNGIPLDARDREATLGCLRHLWGYDVALEEVTG
ncbi:SpoVR family protein [Limimaricola pyoseonensis]|uniref:Stage V sporulation protein SpoVR/YcgB, involved in spore cortex formation n=1 Tax=Limimaricola pyoseonensis TaxID=521013 RepID=A0A1G7JFU3_9RHOB|nr:SpoVR family protein [Limimaricola pyoseonensis]SDF23807.1 Stage V sporulation protein SpoVR/YcgB, involved in spore cortex formation [Limimaricola pyoseonensis]